ncbi:unnamed protein product [Porites lobata]|uniref:SET domain-containing protein n=1 Tax=Porites lobata TaxID=104759 RepID=A0ABN8S317_9CNID|nr:unnamed protein product [Porites lobata]
MLRHKRAAKCPLLSKFLNQCVTTEEGNFVSTSELFSAYETAVSIWTDDDSVHGQTKFLMKRSAFNRQLKKEISTFSFSNNGNVTYGVQNNSRGYFNIKLHRARRMLGHEFGGEQMLRNIAVFMARHPPPVPPIEVHDVPSDPRGAGKCAFAKKDVERGQVVAEYTGELISMTEATKREAEYARVGKTCTLMVIDHRGQSIAIDPYYGDIHAELNLAATINHSRQNANLKPYVDDTSSRARVFFVALHDIPQSVEFLWNYGDADWEYHTYSQTLPH